MNVQDRLRQEHGRSMKMFSVLQKLLDRQEDQDSHQEALRSIVHILKRYVDDCHHGKEEEAVFPELVRLDAPEAQALTRDLVEEHQRAATLLQEMEEAFDGSTVGEAKGPVKASADEYLLLMRGHIRKENARLLPLCRDSFQGETDQRVLERMAVFESTLFEQGEKERLLADLDELIAIV